MPEEWHPCYWEKDTIPLSLAKITHNFIKRLFFPRNILVPLSGKFSKDKVRLTWSSRNHVQTLNCTHNYCSKPSHLPTNRNYLFRDSPQQLKLPTHHLRGHLPTHYMRRDTSQMSNHREANFTIHFFLSHRECKLMLLPWASVYRKTVKVSQACRLETLMLTIITLILKQQNHNLHASERICRVMHHIRLLL